MTDPSTNKTNSSDMLTPLYIFGASSQGLVVAEAAYASGKFTVTAFIDDQAASSHRTSHPSHGNWPIFTRKQISPNAARRMIVAVGDNAARARLTHEMTNAGWTMATALLSGIFPVVS